jgi:hypothetical protein
MPQFVSSNGSNHAADRAKDETLRWCGADLIVPIAAADSMLFHFGFTSENLRLDGFHDEAQPAGFASSHFGLARMEASSRLHE